MVFIAVVVSLVRSFVRVWFKDYFFNGRIIKSHDAEINCIYIDKVYLDIIRALKATTTTKRDLESKRANSQMHSQQ